MCCLGTVGYRSGFELQTRVCPARQQDLIPDVKLLLEHFPVYTRRRRTGAGALPRGEKWYRVQGIDVVDVDQGGKAARSGRLDIGRADPTRYSRLATSACRTKLG